jgi:S-methylmethionine-dependent homocysteine/selenocysteine methylase
VVLAHQISRAYAQCLLNGRSFGFQYTAMVQPYTAVRARLERGEPVILDGALGSLLVARGVRWRDHGLRTDAAAVQALHLEYLEAGAQVLRTNTFQLNRRVYQNVFRDASHMRHIGAPDLAERIPKLISTAVGVALAAREQANRPDVPIAGVMSPLEHCFRPDLAPSIEQAQAEHAELAQLLARAGADMLFLQSMSVLDETRAALEAARDTGLPVWISFAVGADGQLLSGAPLSSGLHLARTLGAEAVLVNAAPPADIDAALDRLLADRPEVSVGALAQIGQFDPPSWKFEFFPQFVGTDAWPSDRYASSALGWQQRGARVLGGCSGTTPEHIRALVGVVQ